MAKTRRGFKYYKRDTSHGVVPGVLDIEVNGSKASGFVGGLVDATTTSDDGGRFIEYLTAVDDDSTDFTLAAADIVAGINVHTSVTGDGTVTTDTAENIIAGVPLTVDGQTIVSYYVNDGDQEVDWAGGTDVTIADSGQIIQANNGAIVIWQRTAATTVTCYLIGGTSAA